MSRALLWAVCVLASCKPVEQPPLPPPDPHHDLVITRGVFHYNGRALHMGDTTAVWTQALGTPTRSSADRAGTIVYASLGMELAFEEGRVVEVFVNALTADEVRATPSLPDGMDRHGPSVTTFPGRLVVEGVAIGPRTTVGDFRRWFALRCDVYGKDGRPTSPGSGGLTRRDEPLEVYCESSASPLRYELGRYCADSERLASVLFIPRDR